MVYDCEGPSRSRMGWTGCPRALYPKTYSLIFRIFQAPIFEHPCKIVSPDRRGSKLQTLAWNPSRRCRETLGSRPDYYPLLNERKPSTLPEIDSACYMCCLWIKERVQVLKWTENLNEKCKILGKSQLSRVSCFIILKEENPKSEDARQQYQKSYHANEWDCLWRRRPVAIRVWRCQNRRWLGVRLRPVCAWRACKSWHDSFPGASSPATPWPLLLTKSKSMMIKQLIWLTEMSRSFFPDVTNQYSRGSQQLLNLSMNIFCIALH